MGTEAVVTIKTVGGAEAAKVIAELARAYADAQKLVQRAAKASGDQQAASARQARVRVTQEALASGEAQVGAARRATARVQQLDQLITRSKLRELALQTDAQRRFVALYTDAHRRATAAYQAETGKRGELTQREKRQVEDLAMAMVSEHEKAERRRTEATRRAAAERRQIGNRRAEIASSGVAAVARAGAAFGHEAHDTIQGARERRSTPEREVGNAIYQAGGTRADVERVMQRMTRFAADERMNFGDIAGAMLAGQTEFSVLGNDGDTDAQREANLQRFMQTALLARNTGNNTGEMVRIQGLLQTAGITDSAEQRRIMLHLAGMAQRGSVELGSVTREAMGAIRGRMAVAADRAQAAGENPITAQGDALRQAMAEIEIARLAGENPGAGANALRNANLALGSTVRMDKLRQNISHLGNATQRRELESLLFEADPTRQGQMRLRPERQNVLEFMDAFREAGVNTESFMTLTEGGGHDNPMSLLANQRRVLGQALLGNDGLARVRRILSPDSALTEDDVRRGEGIFKGDSLATLTGGREERDNALTDNTRGIVDLSNKIHDWQIRHPLLSSAIEHGGTAVTGFATGAFGRQLWQWVFGGGTAAAAAGGATTAATAATAATGAAGAAEAAVAATTTAGAATGAAGSAGAAAAGLTTAAAVTAALGAGLGVGYGFNRAGGFNQESDNPFNAAFYTEFGRSIRDAVRDGMGAATVQVTVDPHAAVHTDMGRPVGGRMEE